MNGIDKLEVVRSFIDAWNRKDRGAIAGAIRDDAEVIGASYPPARGPQETMALSEPFLAADEIDWQIRNHACRGSLVFVERVDRFRYGSKPWLVIPVTGVFDIDDDGMIARWHDYFDSTGIEEAIA